MAVQAFPYLVITDGTLTATFADGAGGATNYAPLRGTWAPAIAGLRKSTLGGRGPYNDVVETWDLNIRGADAATALSNLETLTRLLDNAERFWRLGQNVSPVLFKYTPQGSTIFTTANPLTCLVLGRGKQDETAGLSLSPIFNDVGMYYEIRGVRLSFVRAGQLLDPTAETANSGASNNPTVVTATLASTLTISAPTQIQMGWSGTFWATATLQPVLLYASAANRLVIFEAESGTLGSMTTSVADAANKARGGSVARYTPTDTNLNIIVQINLGGGAMDANARRFAVYAAVRNNSGTTSWQLTTRMRGGVTALNPFSPTAAVPIDVSTTNPRIVFLGTVMSTQAGPQLEIAGQASAASGTLDIDYVAVVAVDDERSGAITTLPNSQTSPLLINPRILTAASPQLTVANVPSSFAGDGMVQTNGNVVAACLLQVTNNYWVMANSGGTVLTNTLSVSRNNAYLSPR